MDSNKKINVEFTPEQFEKLVRLVYLGEWMVNAHRADDDHIDEFDDIEDHILSQAIHHGLEDLAYIDEESGKELVSDEIEEEMQQYIAEYDDENFWIELCDRLALRDAIRIHGEDGIINMAPEDRMNLLTDLDEAYREKFAEEDLENVKVED